MRISFVALLVLAAVAPRAGAEPTVSKMALVTIETTTRIGAPPAVVWSALTDPEKAKAWCPYWAKAPEAESLARVGASIAYRDEYGNSGRSVVVFADPGKQLRVAHSPKDGSYLCQTAFTLAEERSGTLLTVIEQYSDQMDVPIDRDTAAAATEIIESYVQALKQLAESGKGH